MTAFATIDNYLTAFPGTTDGTANAQIQAALDSACSEIRKYCSQTFDLIEGDTLVLHGTGRSTLLLPELPVVAVNTVTIDDGLTTELAITDFRVDLQDGVLYRPPTTATTSWWCGIRAVWPAGFLNITVDYDHGYATIPPDLIRVAVSLAREEVKAVSPRLTGETITNYSYTQTAGLVSIDAYAKVLEPYRAKRVPVP